MFPRPRANCAHTSTIPKPTCSQDRNSLMIPALVLNRGTDWTGNSDKVTELRVPTTVHHTVQAWTQGSSVITLNSDCFSPESGSGVHVFGVSFITTEALTWYCYSTRAFLHSFCPCRTCTALFTRHQKIPNDWEIISMFEKCYKTGMVWKETNA